METSPTPPPERETRKSFDLMASVDMLRFDLQRFGQVLPETLQRVYDEELSGLSEGVERAARTSFTLQRQGGALVYFDGGAYRPYRQMLIAGLETARLESDVDPRRAFLHDWALRDEKMGAAMQALRPGQKMTWYSAYPQEVEMLHGADFMRSCGLVPNRKMGFLYLAIGNPDGSVTLESQTVDKSEKPAFAAAMRVTEFDEAYNMDTLVRAYDGVLAQAYGGKFFAGRRGSQANENAWAELTRHGDLVAYFLDGLQNLAASNLPRLELERATKRHVIGVWKAFKNRLDGKAPAMPTPQNADGLLYYDATAAQDRLAMETHMAYHQARREGDIKIACGGVLKAGGDDPLDTIDGKATFDSIFGKKSSEESYKFDKHMYCVVCQAPPEKDDAKKMCGPCGICKGCDNKIRNKSKGAFALAA